MKKINFRYAVGEVFFIFLGITLAIAFQNWNEQRKQAKLEKTVLKQLKVALQNDFEDVTSNINTHIRAKSSCQNILKLLETSDQIDGMEVLNMMNQAMDYTFLVSDISTYEYLKAVGLHIVENDSLRSQITRLYGVVYEGIYGVEKNVEPVQIELSNHVKNYYTGTSEFFVPVLDVNEMKNDNLLKFDLKRLAFSHQIMINKYQQKVKPELDKLILMVDEELAK